MITYNSTQFELTIHLSFSSFLGILNEYYWMSIKGTHFSSVINLTVSDYVSHCVFSSEFSYMLNQNVKSKFPLYLNSVP
jgi:hypothetical protein